MSRFLVAVPISTREFSRHPELFIKNVDVSFIELTGAKARDLTNV
jgi:hypothetical protein